MTGVREQKEASTVRSSRGDGSKGAEGSLNGLGLGAAGLTGIREQKEASTVGSSRGDGSKRPEESLYSREEQG